MKQRYVNILLFSLLAVIACNNVKASEEESPKSREAELLKKFGRTETVNAVDQLELTIPTIIQLFGEEKLKEVFDKRDNEEQYKKAYLALFDNLLKSLSPNMNEDKHRKLLESIDHFKPYYS